MKDKYTFDKCLYCGKYKALKNDKCADCEKNQYSSDFDIPDFLSDLFKNDK